MRDLTHRAWLFKLFGLADPYSLLRIDALSGIRTSIFGQAMEQAYKGCNSEGGKSTLMPPPNHPSNSYTTVEEGKHS